MLINPAFAQQPGHQTVAVGGTAIFTSAISNTANVPVTNKWRKGSSLLTTNVLNSFSDTLVLSNVTTNDGAIYTCVWQNIAGSSPLSAFAFFIVVVPPTNQTVAAGSNATFSARGQIAASTVRYQWQFEGGNIPNATNSTLTISNVQSANVGTYTAQIINASNMVTSFSAQLSLLALNARLLNAQLAGDGSFSATVEGAANRTYSVEISSDLTNWTELRSLVMTNATVPFNDTSATNAPQRFYRARLAD